MRLNVLRKFGLSAVLCASIFAACSESPTGIPEPQHTILPPYEEPDADDFPDPHPDEIKPVICPSYETFSSTEIITPLGGTVRAEEFNIWIPEGAVSLPTVITLTVPASQYVEVEITALGIEHFVFNKPVRVTIDYSACPWWIADDGPFSVWYWNRATGELLENMNGEDQAWLWQRMVFWTTHLSGYVIAN